MPREAAHGRDRFELVYDITGDEVDVVVAELQAGVADTFPSQLVEFGIVHPLNTL